MIVTLDLPDETNVIAFTLIATNAVYRNVLTYCMDVQKHKKAKATMTWNEGFTVEFIEGGDAE